MEQFKTGFIGYGNMASAILRGITDNGILPESDVSVFDTDADKLHGLGNVHICSSAAETAEKVDILFLCVKPNVIPVVAAEIRAEGKAFVSIAAGVTADKLLEALPTGSRVMRIMPNTPLLVGKGAVCIQVPNNFNAAQQAFINRIFSKLGLVCEVSGAQMDAVTGVSGSGPAYVYLLINELAKAGAANGLSYETALTLARQTFEGACGMLEVTGRQPEELIDAVCSPGGTTLEAMRVFEAEDIGGTIQKAVDACVKRSRELSE